jgi:hypothetical protein
MRRLLLLLAATQAYELCIGQDAGSILNYTAAFGPPACVMSYASLTNLTAALWTGTEYGSGVEDASALLKALPETTALQLGLWLVGVEEDVLSGAYDDELGELLGFMRWAAPRRIFIRIGYEFDSPQNAYEPALFKQAYAKVADKLKGEPNVYRVWHSWSFPETYNGHTFDEWWPGADKVDVCGISVFQQAYGDNELGDITVARDIAKFCRLHKKPLMIAESTPFGVGDAEPRSTIWARWYVPVLKFIREENVVLWSYINDDWDAQKMWSRNGLVWGDSRVEAHPDLAAHWRREVLVPRPLLVAEARAGGRRVAGAALVGILLFAVPWLHKASCVSPA